MEGPVSQPPPQRLPPLWRRWFTSEGTTLEKALVLSLAVLCLVICVILAGMSRFNPNVVSHAEIRTERLSFDVVDAPKAAFFIAGAKIGSLGQAAPDGCVTGLFTPARGTTVSYGRVGKGPIEITIAAPANAKPDAAQVGRFEPEDGGQAIPYRGTTDILTDESCKPPPPSSQRFPIWGYLRIGQEFRPASSASEPEPSFLLSGKLEVAAHAIYTGTLYEVATISLPVGARLQALAPTGSDQPIWWGTATLDPDHVALDVLAATEAPRLGLYRPNQTAADVFELSKLEQLTHDPTILSINFILAILLFFLGCCASLGAHWHEHQQERARRSEHSITGGP